MSAENFTLVENKILSVTAERKTEVEHQWGSAKVRLKPILARWWEKGIGAILPVIILLSWELVTAMHWVKPLFLPSPQEVATSFYDMLVNQGLLTDFRVSATAVIQGFFLGGLLGLFTGIAAGLSKNIERFFGPTLNSLRQVPTLAWLPLIVLWIGAGTFAKSVIIGKTVFFPVFLNTLQGIRGVSKEYVEVARIFEYNRSLLLRKVILPAALPSIFVGVRYGAGLAWAFVIAAEMLGGRYGLGYLLMRSQEMLLTGQLFVVIIVIGTVGFAVDIGLRRVESSLLRWKKGFEG